MPTHLSRRGGAVLAVLAGLAMLVMTIGALPAGADDPVSPSGSTTSVAPTSLVPTPGTAPTTTAPPGTTSTTLPGVVPSSTVPSQAATGNGGGPDIAHTSAPQIPSASTDPLFHAALTVDADMRDAALAQQPLAGSMVAYAAAKKHADGLVRGIAAASASSRVANRNHVKAMIELRAAALRAYTGFGAESASAHQADIGDSTTVLPYRTYMSVTITESTNRVTALGRKAANAAAAVQAATDDHAAAATAADNAKATLDAQTKTYADAEAKVLRDRASLDELVGSLSDLAPGSLETLPNLADLPPGVQLVASPAGQIVVPAKADPRTVVALQFAVAQLGKPYVWGGTGPGTYDCSGLMLRSFQAAGVTSIPRVSESQQAWATPIATKDVQPGDMVFFGTPAYHVGMYIGGGLMLDAPYTGTVVRIDKVWSSVSSFGRAIWSTPAPAPIAPNPAP